jgi:hypothetical protein
MRAGATLLFCVLVACDAPPAEVHDLTLDLADDVPACGALQVAAVSSVEIVAIGEDAAGNACRLARACREVATSASVDAVEDRLMAQAQPVIDVETAALVRVRVQGFTGQGCEGDVAMCGAADAPPGGEGALEVKLTCELGPITERCPATPLPPCP